MWAEVGAVAEILARACRLRYEWRILAVLARTLRVDDEASSWACLRIVPCLHQSLTYEGARARIGMDRVLRRHLLRLRELVALHITRGNPEWLEPLIWPGLPWVLLPLLLCCRMILFVEGLCIIMHDFILWMVDEQSVLVLLCSQLSQRLVLENCPLDDLHYFVLVENSRAQLGFNEALDL